MTEGGGRRWLGVVGGECDARGSSRSARSIKKCTQHQEVHVASRSARGIKKHTDIENTRSKGRLEHTYESDNKEEIVEEQTPQLHLYPVFTVGKKHRRFNEGHPTITYPPTHTTPYARAPSVHNRHRPRPLPPPSRPNNSPAPPPPSSSSAG